MTKQPLVAVMMPAYNTEKYIEEAVQSILNQTYQNFILIIANDASTDRTGEIAKKLTEIDPRIRYMENEKNLGGAGTRNRMLERYPEEADFFMWMDSDDTVEPTMIEKKIDFFMKHPDVDALGHAINYVDDNMQTISVRHYPLTDEEIRKTYPFHSPVSHGGLMLRKELAQFRYREDFLTTEDYELWGRILAAGKKFANLPDVLYHYRHHPSQVKQRTLKESLKLSLVVKSQYIFRPDFFSFKALAQFMAEAMLLALPSRVILWLFFKTLQKKEKQAK